MPNVLITELDQRTTILDTDAFIVQPAAGPPAQYVTASTVATYIGAISGTTYSASTGLSLSTSNFFRITNTAVTAGTYGGVSSVPVLAINAQGQVTSASGAPISITATQVSGAGTVNYVDVSGGLTGLSYNGGPITSSGTITASGTLGVSFGGTSATTAIAAFNALAPTTTSGDLIYRDSTGNVRLAIGSSGQLLTASNGVPVWVTSTTAGAGTVTSVDVSGGGTGLTYSGGPVTSTGTITASGTLGTGFGGTSATTAIAAFNALAPTTTSGDLIYRTSTGNVRLAIGSSGQLLTASGGLPVWINPAASGTVNYVDVSGGSTGLSFNGGPITASGTITATGTLGIGFGGTSATTAIAAFNALAPTTTSGDLIYRTSTGNVRLAIGSSGQVLTASGGVPAWITPTVYGTVNYVDVSGGNTGLTFNGGPVTASGTITASGTLVVSAGGTGASTLTGVLKGTGTTAITAATAGTDYVSPIVATNFTAKQTFAGATSILAAAFVNAGETVTVSTSAATGTLNYDITSQSVLYYTGNSTANFIPNFRGSSGNTLTSILATGQAVTAVWAVTMGTTAFYSTAVQIDGSTAGVTLKWQGGAAPTAGNASSVDAYTYTIIKTASASFTVLAAQTQFA